MVTNNDCNHGATNMGTPIYYMGTQENGGKFTDAAGKMEFEGPGEIGMLDWCAPLNITHIQKTSCIIGLGDTEAVGTGVRTRRTPTRARRASP